MKKTTLVLVIDGYGLAENGESNAISKANKPNLDKMFAQYPFASGKASGLAVGLPDGQMGNSEVGHLNIGAGRIVYQELTRITKAIEDGDFYDNQTLLASIKNVKDNNSDLHVYGLLSNGGVHSHNEHLYGILELAKRNDVENVYIHAFLDGRDTPPSSAQGFVVDLEDKIKEIGVGKIASIHGRYYAMDRDNRWDRVEKTYKALVNGEGEKATSAYDAIAENYSNDTLDEFILPTVITRGDKPVATVKENDSVIFFNFRPDRAREITRAFCDENFDGFDREFMNVHYTCFTDYDASLGNKHVVFTKEELVNTLGEYVSTLGKKQLRIAETEKYAHVTFFFNGGVETPYSDEDRELISSPKVATYDLQPEMSVDEVCTKLIEKINSKEYDLIVCNFANPDMVGHTGDISATVEAVEAVDTAIGKVHEALVANDAQMFLCADHGNADKMLDEESGVFTAHTTNDVPFCIVNAECSGIKEGGRLCDIAPTVLEMMNLEIPKEMTGNSLLIK